MAYFNVRSNNFETKKQSAENKREKFEHEERYQLNSPTGQRQTQL